MWRRWRGTFLNRWDALLCRTEPALWRVSFFLFFSQDTQFNNFKNLWARQTESGPTFLFMWNKFLARDFITRKEMWVLSCRQLESHCLEDGWSFSLRLVARPLNSKGCNLLMSRENLGYILSWSWSSQIASCCVDCAKGRSLKGVKMWEKQWENKSRKRGWGELELKTMAVMLL